MLNQNNNFFKFLSLEDKIHAEVVSFIKNEYPDVIFTHVPSESKKSAFERYKHSIMGTKKGMLDIVILHPKYKTKEIDGKKQKVLVYCGLCVELKVPEYNRLITKGKKAGKTVKTVGRVSDEQQDVIDKLNKVKYKALACFGAESAINEIKEYLS